MLKFSQASRSMLGLLNKSIVMERQLSTFQKPRIVRTIFGISDLHLEFYPDHSKLWESLEKSLPNADILVLAGDIGIPSDGVQGEYASLLRKFKSQYNNVVLVAGNHEYYRSKKFNRESVQRDLANICNDTGVVFLNNTDAVVAGVKFFGTTLWSKADESVAYGLNDIGRVFRSVGDYNAEHKTCFEWLKRSLETYAKGRDGYSDKCVVVTHHLPSFNLTHPRFKGYTKLNTAFYTELLPQLNLTNVGLWFCGHTHEYAQYVHKQISSDGSNDAHTTIIVNPVGYPKEKRETKIMFETYTVTLSEDSSNSSYNPDSDTDILLLHANNQTVWDLTPGSDSMHSEIITHMNTNTDVEDVRKPIKLTKKNSLDEQSENNASSCESNDSRSNDCESNDYDST